MHRESDRTVSDSLLAAGPQYPVPPADLSAPQTMSTVFLVICGVFMAVSIGYVVWRAVKGDALGLFFLLAGLLMGTLEPGLDYLGLLWFADDNVAIAIEMFGRHIPLYVVLGYSFFFGLQAYFMYLAITVGKNARFFVYAYAVSWVFDLMLQATGSALGLYKYYGNQPFLILGVPAWWFSIDALMPTLTALIVFGLRHRLQGWGKLILIPLVPALYAGLNGAAGTPVFAALNSNYDPSRNGNGSDLLVWLGGTLTIALCLFFLWLVIGEIGNAQRRAGIRISESASVLDVLQSKAGMGLGEPVASTKVLSP
jgi:hypothetical protein